MIYLLVFFLSFIGTIFSLPFLIGFLIKEKVVDLPNERKIHTIPIPRMGGIIIYLIVTLLTFPYLSDLKLLLSVLFSSFLLVVCGVWDDIIGMKWNYKFILQVISALTLIFYFDSRINTISFFNIVIPNPLNYLLLLLFIIGVINSINFMDGLDGLVAGYSIQVLWILLALSIIAGDKILIIIIVSLLGSLLGFLKYNAFPAKIFLGDTGSLTLGFFLILTSLLITIDSYNNNLDLTFPVILLGVPIVDTLKVIFLRIKNKKHIFLADKSHLHHTIIDGKVHHKITVVIVLLLSSLYGIDSIIYLKASRTIAVFIFIMLSIVLIYVPEILNKITKMRFFLSTQPKIIHFSKFLEAFFLRLFLPLSFILVILLLFITMPGTTSLRANILYVFLSSVAVMLMITFSRRLVNKNISDIYVLINFLVFFICSDFSYPIFYLFGIYHNAPHLTAGLFFAVITVMVLFFISERDILFTEKKIFLTGLDITLLVVIMFLYVLDVILSSNKLNFFGINLIEAFVLYLWYKVVIYFNVRISRFVFYGSFVLPMLAIIIILVNS